jgi:hypothetical protein
MKKLALAVSLAALLSLMAFGAVSAQGVSPLNPGGNGGRGNGDGVPVNQSFNIGVDGRMTDYMHAAYADVLGLTVEALDARINAGETIFAIAESLGMDFYTIQDEARLAALEMALADGAITEDAFNFLQNPGNGQGNGQANGQGNPESGNGTGNVNSGSQSRIRGNYGSKYCTTAAP